jgi:hypothetical protein
MPEHDQHAFKELFDSEPTQASAPEAARWVDVYQRLVAMMERQLDETRTFAANVDEPMRRYLSRENMTILEEEITAFKARLDHWNTKGVPES